MAVIFNIRGTNGSGKSTLARAFLPPRLDGSLPGGGPVDLNWYASPTKKEPARLKRAEGYYSERWDAVVIGRYDTACGGMDAMPGFEVCQGAVAWAVEKVLPATKGHQQAPGAVTRINDAVICEGVLASTVYGSWGVFADNMRTLHHNFVFVYLQTPVELCLERIKQRQRDSGRGERPIKEDQVRAKVKAIAATRTRALAAGHVVFDLPLGDELPALQHIVEHPGTTEFRACR